MKQETKFKQTEIGMIPEDWEIKEFSKVLKIKGRIGWKGYTRQDLVDEGPFVIGGKEINSTRYLNLDEAKHLSREKFGESPEIKLKKDDILLVTRGNLGEVGFFDGSINEATINPSLVILSEFIEEPLFLFYYLLSSQGNKNIMGLRSGSSVPAIYQAPLKKIKYPSPPISEQKAIAKILSDLDSKIELLQNQNKTLEAIGKAIFKRWFVDFEFPNEKGEPYKSSGGKMVESEMEEIPTGWSTGNLGDKALTKLSKTGIDNFNEEKTYLATACIENNSIIDQTNKITIDERPSRANMQPKPNTVWFAKMKDSKKIIYFDDYCKEYLEKFILSTGFAGLDVEENALYYLWCFILNPNFEVLKDNLCHGTTMQAINNGNIQKIRILIPTEEDLLKFNNLVKPIFQKSYENSIHTHNLRKIRDSLLPKLMSGKIRVPIKNEK